jgi:gas vesicle protein
MDNNNGKSNNNFLSGFLLGALIGGAIVFLLGTEKGKKILKAISDEGLDNLSDILEKADKATNLDEVFEEEEEQEISPKTELIEKESSDDRRKPKRFFRGISRHLN